MKAEQQKQLVVIAATNGSDLTFTVIYQQDEILYGTVKQILFNDTPDKMDVKLNLKAECWQRKTTGALYGFTEKFYKDPADYIWKYEQHQNECICEAVKKAIPDGEIVQIINI